jgi:predicted dehydrogenase
MVFDPTELVGVPQRPGRFALVGHGWRADFFLRVARQAPEFFVCAGVVTRTEDVGVALEREWGVSSYRSIEELIAEHEVDVVVVCIPRAQTPAVVTHLVELGLRVLTETPPAATVEGLADLWSRVGESGLVCVAEQTPYVPIFAAAQQIVGTGALGDVTSAALSWTHDYHAMAVLRGALGIAGEPLTISVVATTEPLLDAANRRQGGFPLEITDHLHTRAFLQAEHTTGSYDFVAGQWYQPLRQRRFLVRGTRGELDEQSVVWSGADGTPMSAPIQRRQLGVNGNLEGADFDTLTWGDRVVYRNRFQGSRLSDDEIAVATCLLLAAQPDQIGGYTLAEASQDAYLALCIHQAVADQKQITTTIQPWNNHLN